MTTQTTEDFCKVNPPKPRIFSYFIGIDVSKNKLDIALYQDNIFISHKVIENKVEDISDYVKEIKSHNRYMVSKSVFCMENTGNYCNPLLTFLSKIKANIVVESSLHIRNSFGTVRGKYDKIDSMRIAQYAYKDRDRLRIWEPRRPIINSLASLFTLRRKLLDLKGAVTIPLTEQLAFSTPIIKQQNKALCKNSLDAISNDLKQIDGFIANVIRSDPRLNRLMEIITSVSSVGPVTALLIIITTNEFKNISDPKKFACYAGVAPFVKESGTVTGKAKVSNIANKKMKALLNSCAVNASRFSPDLREYYIRKTEKEGKAKMSVLNAIRNKLILRIFACVKQDRLYNIKQPDIKYSSKIYFNEFDPVS
ncbi:IS110 family transposase [Mucilaginibacter sp. AW1-7]|uniref:IS110 family transposase n=1 Tax=Mucilaginibacter sp. AW1-7 TaxID=3349874 RepID=UPI003F73D949